nr:4Fe-4S single cluster domain-containing protein [uncultured Acetatifactor sp.]
MRTIEAKISLGRMYYPVKALGPGNRVGIWMNGCHRRCAGCISPELQMYDTSKEVTVNELVKMIQRIESPIDGFTISGGEPFLNPLSLNALVQSLAGICDDILIFTGYTIEELRAQESETVDSVLNICAVLIDGPYIQELNENKGLRGSSNQRCLIFKYHDRYQGIENSDRTLQNIMYGNKVLTIGIPQGEMAL